MPVTTLVSWGELLWDLYPDGPRLGGAAANVAYHASVLGARALLVSRVGDDELGRRAREGLERHGVDTRFVQTDSSRPTGSVRVEIRDGEPTFQIGEEAAWDAIALEPELAAELRSANAFVFGTLAQRTPLGSSSLAAALAQLPPGCPRIVDLNVRPPHDSRETIVRAVAHADVVKLNQAEAVRVAHALGDPDWPRALLARGVRLIAVTSGGTGAELRTASESVTHGGFAIDPARGDRVGAGDAFSAALALELCRGTALAEIARRANLYASFVASMPGAMPAPPQALLDQLRRRE